MTVPYLWVPNDPGLATGSVVLAMERALRVHARQTSRQWNLPGLGVGVLECDPCGTLPELDPVQHGDGRYLWMFGEAFRGGKLLELSGVSRSREARFRRQLFEAIERQGFEGLTSLDGEYVVVHWNAAERTLTLANDRFGGLPLYWTLSPAGLAIAGGVRGALVAPGVDPAPDDQAIREAVTFGGFRLSDRTNVRSVKMLPGGTILTFRAGSLQKRRYWSFRDIPSREAESTGRLLDEGAELWKRAIEARLDDCERPGQTLSGGLDSRAILAEAAPRARSWSTVTYGVPNCDDGRIAERAAREAGARWRFVHLYERGKDWLSSREQHIQPTDGLIALGDLMHVETVGVQAEEMHVHLSGYIGDAVCGPTFADIEQPNDLYGALPYYGTLLGMTAAEAHERILSLAGDLSGERLRYAVFENKLPQATNRWTAAWRPWLRVRKPFVDFELFDFWQGLPPRVRIEQRLYEQLLRSHYPKLFRSIPNQKTGVPVLTPKWRWQAARVRRFVSRKLRNALGAPAPSRAYHDDLGHADPEIRARIQNTILRSDSLCCEILGRENVKKVVDDWFDRGASPEQVVGALYVYESYHRELGSHLRAARAP